MTLADDLALAHELADAADEITLARFGAVDLVVEAKPDLTPVSDADRAVEHVVRSTLASRRPGDAVLGEEDGESGTGPRRWVVDPVDGTKNFVRGVPVWATLSRCRRTASSRPALVSAPALGRRWWASRGRRRAHRRCAVAARGACRSAASARCRTRRSRTPRSPAGTSRAGCPGCSGCRARSGAPGRTATSGRTCWWPRARSTRRSSPRCRCGTSRRCRSSSRRPAGASPTSPGEARPDGGSVVCSNGLLHDGVLDALAARA